MKITIIKSFAHGELRAKKGEVIEVGNNLGHGLVEKGLAVKAVEKPKRNKMMTRKKLIVK